jgi:tetratricopeptide (TPR) repeat protein
VGKALLIEYYNELPQAGPKDKDPRVWAARVQKGLEAFKEKVGQRYTEGTLQRLLQCPAAPARRAAVLALGMLGTGSSNSALAAMLHDDDAEVKQLAADALWSLWFRAEGDGPGRELRRLSHLEDPKKAVAAVSALILKAPRFAEAYNQRAILYFRLEEYQLSVADCEKAAGLNPCHFGAFSGMGQCYMKLNKPDSALKAFRNALRINPGLDGVEETVHFLEEALGEEGRKDDKK